VPQAAGRQRMPGPRPGPLDRARHDLAARYGRDAAHAEWFYGFRLLTRTAATIAAPTLLLVCLTEA
jgi:hypothetical protein